MSASRENADLFFRLWGRYPSGRLHIADFNLKIFKNPYFWQDTFRTRFKRLFGCKHKNAENINRIDEKVDMFCFDCYRHIKRKN